LNYLEFRPALVRPHVKTKVWLVTSVARPNHDLGLVRWFPQWRRYVIETRNVSDLFDANCLREIADHCERETKAHGEDLRAIRDAR
jgi:hypothetical protein